MQFTAEQKASLASWLKEGLSLSDIQKRIVSDFGLKMTYMDLRFLIDDLDLEVVRPAAPEPEATQAEAESNGADEEAVDSDNVAAFPGIEEEDTELAAEGGVLVEIDAVMRPGALVSGEVTFSDGVQLGWQLDNYGRLGLIPSASTPEGYSPPEADIPLFQTQLQQQLQKQGF